MPNVCIVVHDNRIVNMYALLYTTIECVNSAYYTNHLYA